MFSYTVMLFFHFSKRVKLFYLIATITMKLHLNAAYGCEYSAMRKMYIDCSKPDVAFYIAARPNDIFRRNVDRPDGKTTLYRDIEHILQLTRLFEQLVQDSELICIHGMRSCEDVHKQILSVLKDIRHLDFEN